MLLCRFEGVEQRSGVAQKGRACNARRCVESALWWLPERTTPTRRFFLPGEGRWTRVIRTRACYVRHEMRVRPSCTDLLSVRSPTDTRTHTRAVHASACVQCPRVVCACSACGQCMGVGHACSACGQCMGAGHACTACVQWMRAVHACSACVQCMRVGHACSACVKCMRVVHGCSACVQCMRAVHACSACAQCMRAVHTRSACAQCMRAGHACTACVQCVRAVPRSPRSLVRACSASCVRAVQCVRTRSPREPREPPHSPASARRARCGRGEYNTNSSLPTMTKAAAKHRAGIAALEQGASTRQRRSRS